MRLRPFVFAMSLLLAVVCPIVSAQVVAKQPNQVMGNEITPAQQDSVARGLAYLAGRQQKNGSYGASYGGSRGHAGITGLAGIAFMGAGNLPGRGQYGTNVQQVVDFMLGASQESGLVASDNTHGAMYGHGFATLFLAEVYGMTGDDRIKEKLQKAVRLIHKTQNKDGGWRYTPAPQDADISVTICQVMALRAARDAGIKVEKDVIDQAVSYVRRCQNGDGGFSYQAHGPGAMGMQDSAFPRSAAGCATLYYAGIFEGKELEKGLAYVNKFIPGKGNANQEQLGGYYFYGHYYAAQAMFLAGGPAWAKWYPAVRDHTIGMQNRQTGGWQGEASEDYATAMALIILQMPNRYLPVFHGKGPGA